MAEPHPRAGRPRKRRRPVRALLLLSAIAVIVLSGLFTAHAASAAPVVKTVPAAAAAPAAAGAQTGASKSTAHFASNQLNGLLAPSRTAAGVCNVPGVGDIGGLIGLCNAGSGFVGDVNNVCTPGLPQPELANSGIDSLITTPGGQTTGKTLYDNYGISGQYWAATGLKCSDLTSQIGNNVAGMVFDMAKSLDRVTITVYQSAAGANILSWLSSSVDRLITALGNAVYFPFLAPVVIIGAIWLAWQGLVRKRATRTLEGTIWMVMACAAAVWLIGRPADFTNVGTTVSNGVTSVLNTAFAKLPATAGSNCLPVANNDPQSVNADYSFTSGNGLVDQNANELWSVLVCKPWLDGEFGTTVYAVPGSSQPQTIVNQYGRQLLFAQSVATNEQPTADLVNFKQQTYAGIAMQLQQNNPSVFALFQGNQWTTRLEIGFSALFAAVAAGLLVLLIALTLIILKLGFLLLLVAGPFFLIVGLHPGFGRVIAVRWFEMLVGVLMKQVAVALTLSVLLYCYSLIMGTTDQALPWALKIIMIALVTVAVFIYRKPFQHLFSSVGYGMLGADERAQGSLRESTFGFRRVTAGAASVVSPGMGARAASRWARRGVTDPGTASDGTTAGGGGVTASGVTIPEGMSVGPATDSHAASRQWGDAGVGAGGRPAPPLPVSPHGRPTVNTGAPSAGWARSGASGTGTGARGPARPPARQGTTPPPVRQSTPPPAASRPPSGSTWPAGSARSRSADSASGTAGGAAKPAAPFWSRSRRQSK
jgi:TrbL/VirB6 plasmid conjugal transfer protein